jgi:hypothetical protein
MDFGVVKQFLFSRCLPIQCYPGYWKVVNKERCKGIRAVQRLGAGATFDWTFFDDWNRRKVLRRPSKVVMFDLDLVRRGNSNCQRLN